MSRLSLQPAGRVTRFRRRTITHSVDRMFDVLAKVSRLAPSARPWRHGLDYVRNIPYANEGVAEHRLDVYRPAGEGPHPIVLYIHGGGFRTLSKDTHWLMGLAFARRGIMVVNVDYRLAPAHRYPAGLSDLALALEWIREESPGWGGDPSRLVFSGESAGANLATALTVAACYRRPEPHARRVFDANLVPKATIPMCGILQVSKPERFASTRFPSLITDPIYMCAEEYLAPAVEGLGHGLADPLLILESDEVPERPLPAFFAGVGTYDPLIGDTRRLAAALADKGVRCEARYYEREIHAFHAFIWRKRARRAWDDTFDFLADVLGMDALIQPERGVAEE